MDKFLKTIKPFLILIFLVNLFVLGIFVLDLRAKEIIIGVAHTRAPYIIKETDSGLEIDIIRAAFNQQNYSVKFRYLTNKRMGFFLKKRKLDAILLNKAYDIKKHLGIDAFYSDVHITYHNYAISLSKNRFSISSINDLQNKHVVGFQDAQKYLGSEFAKITKKNPDYIEKPEQMTQVYWLFLERTQIVVMDKFIFIYHRKNALETGRFDVADPVTFHNIFPDGPIHGVFWDRQLRNELNLGLKKIQATGQYDKIVKKYEQHLQVK
jgi:polar amino acid transport system substrate-binding protein